MERFNIKLANKMRFNGEFEELFNYCTQHESNVDALNILSDCYSLGLGVSFDFDKSLEIDNELIAVGCPEAMARTGFTLLFTKKNHNPDKGIELIDEAIRQGCGRASRYMAHCYADGAGVEQDYSRALKLYEQAIAHEDYASCAYLGLLYEAGNGVKKDINIAIALYKQAVDYHIGIGCLCLAYCYEEGIGTDKNVKCAIDLLNLGKLYGNASSIRRLGKYYENGLDDIETDASKAFSLYYEAASKGNRCAIRDVGRCYLFGVGVEKNIKKAIEYFDKSIEISSVLNIDEWYISLGELLDECQEYSLGLVYYQKAAELGNVEGLRNLAINYENGYGVDICVDIAMDYYKQASDLGDLTSTVNLGLFYYHKEDVTDSDLKFAIVYLEKALEMGEIDLTQNTLIEIIDALISCYKDKDSEKTHFFYKKLHNIYEARLVENDGVAEYNLGLIYKSKDSGYYDLEKAFEYFEQGVLKRNIDAAFKLSACYEIGRGVNVDLRKAFSIIASFQNDYEKAKCYIGVLYQYGIGTKKNPEKAVSIFLELSKCNDGWVNTAANICLAICYYHGEGVKKNTEKAKELFIVAPVIYQMYIEKSLGYSGLSLLYRAYFEPGDLFGNVFKPDLKKSFEFEMMEYQETHDAWSSYHLGLIYLEGSKEIKRNLNKAYKFLSESGTKDSIEEIAILAYYGFSGNMDSNKVISQLSQLAQDGSSRARLYIGLCYYHGYSLKQNKKNAIKCFQEASQIKDYYGWIGLALSSLLSIADTESFVLSYDSAISNFKYAAQNNTFIKELMFNYFIDNDNVRAEVLSRAASISIEFVELYLKKDYVQNRIELIKPAIRIGINFFIQQKKYRCKDADGNNIDVIALFRQQMQLQKNEIERLSGEIEQRDQVISNQTEVIETLKTINDKIDNLTVMTSTIEENIQEIHGFITSELTERLIASKMELSRLLSECSERIIKTQEKNESAVIQRINSNSDNNIIADFVTTTRDMFDEEREMLISSFITNISNYINENLKVSNMAIENERQHLQNIFGTGWSKLQPSSQTSLISAGVLWKSCEDITNQNFDFSGICISATSALESELKKWFFNGFQDYLTTTYGSPDSSDWRETFKIWPDQLLNMSKQEYENKLNSNIRRGISDIIEIKLKNDFTIGSIPYLFGIRSVSRRNLLITRLDEYLNTIVLNNGSITSRDLFIRSNPNIGMSLVDCCEMIRKQYRNPSAHIEVVNRSTAEECYQKVIGKIATYHYTHNITGLLIEIMNLFKDYN